MKVMMTAMRNEARGGGRRLAGLAGLVVVLVLAGMAWAFREEIRRWNQLFRSFDRLGRNAQGYSEYRHTRTGIVFVRLPGGQFTMGSREAQDRPWDERPAHTVRLSPFLIAKYEVSRREWPGRARSGVAGSDGIPVSGATWDDCRAFCEKNGLRLPSEAQWEYAARGGAAGGSGGTDRLSDVAWHGGGGERPAGRKEPNGFGLHDVLGNVWEWCEDVYNEAFYSSPEASGPDPVCSKGLGLRVLRGGSWESPAAWCRAGFRGTGSVSLDQCGFRPVWVFP